MLLSPIVLVPLSVMAAQSFGGEYRFGMIRLTLSTFPRRTRVMLAKLWTISLWVLAFLVLTTVVALVVAQLFPQYVEFALDGTIALYVLRALAYGLAYCLWVFALVPITRNQALSIVLVLVWALLIEPVALQLLGGKFPWLDKALPMTAGAAFAQGTACPERRAVLRHHRGAVAHRLARLHVATPDPTRRRTRMAHPGVHSSAWWLLWPSAAPPGPCCGTRPRRSGPPGWCVAHGRLPREPHGVPRARPPGRATGDPRGRW